VRAAVDLTAFAIAAICVVVAAFVQGTIGVGFALIVAPIVGLLAPTLLPVCLLVLMLPLNVYVAWRERAALDRSGAGWITLGRLAGTFGGLWILAAVPQSALAVLVGGATILAAVATLALPAFRPGRQSFVAAGLVTGVTETATGIGGPPLALVYQHQAAAVLRSTLAFCFLVGQLISLAVLAVAGRTSAPQFEVALLLVPPLALGAFLSRHVHHRVDGRVFRMFVLLFAIVSGAVLVFKR
jgi:uncharacterized protein